MSGLYADVIGARIPYDVDATIVARITSANAVTVYSAGEQALLNNESSSDYADTDQGGSLLFLFPNLMDINGFFLDMANNNGAHTNAVLWSADTTNGVDGTWATLVATPAVQSTLPFYRSGIITAARAGVRALKFTNTMTGGYWHYNTVHIYGSPAATSDRLEFWHPTLDQALSVTPAFLDWAEVSRGTVAPPTKDFRIKNLASILTANSVVVSHQTLTDPSNAFKSAHTLSADGGSTYTATVTISSIAAGSISPIIKVKYAPLITDPLSLQAGRIITTTGSWT
jgi:hypothetical protein